MVLREYPSNGLDSHVLAGQDRPVELTLPSALNPNFIVRDFGVGMSKDDLNNIYSRYGASTKRDSNTQIGGFGLGAKSALTISPQFTVISVKDGEKNVVLVSKGEDGVGALNFIATMPTDEPNGVEVTIPIKNITKFLAESKLFFLGINPDDILVDGKRIEDSVYNAEKWIDIEGLGWFDTTSLAERGVGNRYNQKVSIKVGPVIYPLDNSTGNFYDNYHSLLGANGNSIVVNVNIGDVDLTPSREGLRYNEKTIKSLKEAFVKYESVLQDKILEKFETLDNRSDAANFLVKANEKGFKIPYLWHGEEVPKEIVFEPNTVYMGNASKNRALSTNVVKAFKLTDLISSYNSKDRYRVTVADLAEKDRLFKNIKDYGKALNIQSLNVFGMVKDANANVWFNDIVEELSANVIFEQSLAYRREQRSKRIISSGSSGRTGSQAPAYFAYLAGSGVAPSKKLAIDLDDDVVYLTGLTSGFQNLVNEVRANPRSVMGYNFASQFKLFDMFLEGRQVVFIPNNISFDRFSKLFPNAVNFLEEMAASIKAWGESLTEGQKAYVQDTVKGNQTTKSASYFQRIIDENKISEIKNRNVRERIEIQADTEFAAKVNTLNVLNSYSHISSPLKAEYVSIAPKKDQSVTFEKKYALLAAAGLASAQVSIDHIIGYMNLADSIKI